MQTESEDLRNETAPTLLDVAKSSDKEQKESEVLYINIGGPY
jgi:hypothetical protein